MYLANVPEVLRSNKSGFFLSGSELKKYKIDMDVYYEQLLAKKSRGF